jgi:hypothetical protein
MLRNYRTGKDSPMKRQIGFELPPFETKNAVREWLHWVIENIRSNKTPVVQGLFRMRYRFNFRLVPL